MDIRVIVSGLVAVALMVGLFGGSYLFPRVLTETQIITTTITQFTSFITGKQSLPFIDASDDFTLYKGSLDLTYKGMSYISSLGLGST